MRSYDSVKISRSRKRDKKFDAVFRNSKTGKTKTVSFGAKGYSDYTMHKDDARKSRYIQRHKRRENWNKPDSAGALSRYVLWGDKSLSKSIQQYKSRFHLK